MPPSTTTVPCPAAGTTSVLAGGQPWQRGYAIVGVFQVLLALAFGASSRRWGGGPAPGGAAWP
mgnify:CR=1 FL=1